MKRFVSVLALMLILSLCLTGTSQALNHPWEYERPDNETHPWGGDEVIQDPPPITIDSKYGVDPRATGIFVVDVIVRFIFNQEYIIRSPEKYRMQEAYNEKLENKNKRKFSNIQKERIR